MSGEPLDPRIARGTAAMLEQRAARLAAGEQPLGWKLGFGAPAALEKLGTDRPLVGYLLRSGLLQDGAQAAVGGWTGPALEPEIAVHLGRDVGPGASRDEVEAAIAGLSAAIELADVDVDTSDPELILGRNIFQRHVLLGPVDSGRTGADGIRARLVRDGEEVAATDTPEALTGELTEGVRLAAGLLGAAGERLHAGDVLIAGSVVPPLRVAPGQRVTAEIEPLGSLTVELT